MNQEELNNKLRQAVKDNNVAIAEETIREGADVNAKPLGELPTLNLVKADKLVMLTLLLANGAEVDSRFYNGGTMLHKAARENAVDAVKLLIKAGADVNSESDTKSTALFSAAFNGSIEVAKLLIEADANTNLTDDRNCSPLYWAAREGHVEIVKLLVENGADINIQENIIMEEVPNGDSPLRVAERNQWSGDGKKAQYLEIIKYLQSQGGESLPVWKASR